MAPQNQQRNLLAMILSGGGRGDPYANEASGPFASSPRVYGSQSPAAGPPSQAKAVPVPATRPKQGGGGGSKGGGGGSPKAAGGQFNLPLAASATSPSSLLQSPELNATSPSSLMQTPGTPYRQVMPAPPNIGPPPYPGAVPATGMTQPPNFSQAATGNILPSPIPRPAATGMTQPPPRFAQAATGNTYRSPPPAPPPNSRATVTAPKPFSWLDPSTWAGS
jgi:hypothetical protein